MDVATALLKERWDFICYTGSTQVGKMYDSGSCIHSACCDIHKMPPHLEARGMHIISLMKMHKPALSSLIAQCSDISAGLAGRILCVL